MNPKEPKLMDKLKKGLRIINTMDVHDLDGRSINLPSELVVKFRLVEKL